MCVGGCARGSVTVSVGECVCMSVWVNVRLCG